MYLNNFQVPSLPLSPPSRLCGSPRPSTTKPDPPSSTASASKLYDFPAICTVIYRTVHFCTFLQMPTNKYISSIEYCPRVDPNKQNIQVLEAPFIFSI